MMVRLRRLTLRTTVAGLLLLAFIVMGALYYYQAQISKQVLVGEITARLLHSVRLMKQQTELLLKDAHALLGELTNEEPPLAGGAACARWLARQENHNPASGHFAVALPSGKVVCASRPSLLSRNMTEREYFRRALNETNGVVSQLVHQGYSGSSVIASAISVREPGHDGVVAVYIYSINIERLIERFLGTPANDGRLIMQDEQGNVLGRYPDPEHLTGTNRSTSALFQTVKRGADEGTFELAGLDGAPQIYTYSTLHGAGFGKLYLIYGISKELAEAPAQKTFYTSLAIGAGALMLFMLVVYAGGERIFVRRIAALGDAVDKLRRGNLAARSGERHAADEIGRLAHSIDDMAATLERKDTEVKRLTRALRVVSSGNRCMLHATNEHQLYHDMCSVVVNTGGYHIACVGMLDKAEGAKLRLVGFAGPDRGLVGDWQAIWDQNHPDGITREAIRKGEVVVARHTSSAASSSWRRGVSQRYGYESLAAIPLKPDGDAIGALVIGACQATAFEEDELTHLRELAGDLAYGITHLRTRRDRDRIAYEHRHHEEILRQALAQTVQTIAATVEIRDPYTAGHQRRVAQLASAIAEAMGLAEHKVEGLKFAAILHDVGKITIPGEILAKPTVLSDIERMLVRTHSKAGYDILKEVKFPWPIADIILQHHERLDGSGYPSGLRGEEILLEARILAVADTVEAMMSHRPYRASLGIEAALAHIREQRGVRLDPAAVDACLLLFEHKRFSFDA